MVEVEEDIPPEHDDSELLLDDEVVEPMQSPRRDGPPPVDWRAHLEGRVGQILRDELNLPIETIKPIVSSIPRVRTHVRLKDFVVEKPRRA